MDVPLARNVTLPVGIPPLPVTEAVNVTVDSTIDGLGAELTTVDVVASNTVSASGADVLALSSILPANFATME
jgi:hypothetical protein